MNDLEVDIRTAKCLSSKLKDILVGGNSKEIMCLLQLCYTISPVKINIRNDLYTIKNSVLQNRVYL